MDDFFNGYVSIVADSQPAGSVAPSFYAASRFLFIPRAFHLSVSASWEPRNSVLFVQTAPILLTKQHRYDSMIPTVGKEFSIIMQIALTELKVNVGRYVDLASTEDVVITKYGKPTAKIIRFDKEPWYMKRMPEEVTSVEQLFGTIPEDIDLEDVRMERLAK
jgi:prevent-host-death family protein